jgi:hypothetical protein
VDLEDAFSRVIPAPRDHRWGTSLRRHGRVLCHRTALLANRKFESERARRHKSSRASNLGYEDFSRNITVDEASRHLLRYLPS